MNAPYLKNTMLTMLLVAAVACSPDKKEEVSAQLSGVEKSTLKKGSSSLTPSTWTPRKALQEMERQGEVAQLELLKKHQEKRLALTYSNYIFSHGNVHRIVENLIDSDEERAKFDLIKKAWQQAKKAGRTVKEGARILVYREKRDIVVAFSNRLHPGVRGNTFSFRIIFDANTKEIKADHWLQLGLQQIRHLNHGLLS
ncbi:MAG: hypothetical protein ACI8WB_005200 [Phenylobacterium sp.]|jgi:hypothetical protein